MSWKRLIYYPESSIKTHIVHSSVVDIVKRDVENRYQTTPVEEVDDESLRIDPGGMIMMNNKPNKITFNGSSIEVKPEHIIGATYRWGKHRILDEKLSSGEDIYKVYLSTFCCAVIPESLYFEIGSWLAQNQGEGHIARAEITEALSGHPNIMIAPLGEDVE